MRRLRLYGLLLLVSLGIACSNDDGTLIETGQEALPEFQIIGEDENSIFLYTSTEDPDEGSILNLSEFSGVNRQYLTLRQTDNLVSFYTFASDNFSVVFHDVGTNSNASYPNFYTVSDERAITWGSNSEDEIYLGFYSPRGTRNYNVRIMDPVSGDFTDVPIEDNTTQAFSPLYANGRLALPYRDVSGNYKIAVLDTDNAALIVIYNFGSSPTSVFLNGFDELGVLSSPDQLNYQYNFYDLQNGNQTGTGDFQLSKFFAPGPLDANISDNKLYYINFFAQPYPVTTGPAVFDLGNQEDLVIDILGIKQEVETEIGNPIVLTDIHFLESAALFAIGYAEAGDQSGFIGGVVFIRPNGEKVYRLELPFVPTYIVRE